MAAMMSRNRRYWIAGAGFVALAAGACGFLYVYPPLGPLAATIVPQRYVEVLTDGDLPQRGRYILVDAASARLFMIEDGHVKDSMRVIVGKPETPTPALKSVIYYETLNPYWHVTPDLVKTLIAPRVLK